MLNQLPKCTEVQKETKKEPIIRRKKTGAFYLNLLALHSTMCSGVWVKTK